MLNNLMLVAYCEEVFRRGWVYWYGTCGYKCTMDLYKRKAKQYPSHYTTSRESGYMTDIKDGKTCADCVGMIKSFFWKGGDINAEDKYNSNHCPDVSANGMFALCLEKGHIDTIPDVPGLVVHKPGHIGVYIGNGYTIEMNGFVNDCLRRKVTDGPWTSWGRLPASMLEYVDVDTTIVPDDIKFGDTGEAVEQLQKLLMDLGYPLPKYGADGDFGRETEDALKAFQRDHGLPDTGVLDDETMRVMWTCEPKPPEEGNAEAETTVVEVTGSVVNLRYGPGTEYGVFGKVSQGTRMEWIATAYNGWYAVRMGERVVWISNDYSEVCGK